MQYFTTLTHALTHLKPLSVPHAKQPLSWLKPMNNTSLTCTLMEWGSECVSEAVRAEQLHRCLLPQIQITLTHSLTHSLTHLHTHIYNSPTPSLTISRTQHHHYIITSLHHYITRALTHSLTCSPKSDILDILRVLHTHTHTVQANGVMEWGCREVRVCERKCVSARVSEWMSERGSGD
jgi:hypothetical protein